MLDLRVLNYFLTVAREESITRAAEALQKDPATLCARLLTQATPTAQAATLRTELQRQ